MNEEDRKDFELSWNDMVLIKTCGYKEAVFDLYQKIIPYAYSSHITKMIYKHCPEAFVKPMKLDKGFPK
jgi:hypothetical protein